MEQALARASVKVSEDGDRFKFNTAISALMILLNTLETEPVISKETAKTFIILLAPFAPHLAEHLWEELGGEGSVHQQLWPEFDASLLASSTVEITVQVNGKRRGSVRLAADAAETDAVTEARKLSAVTAALAGNEPKRVIYVSGKILNFVL
jgi:leucyl-tRNA synthetase